MIDNSLPWNVSLFSGHPIGQLCLGGPGYSSHTVIHGMLQCSDDISVVRVLFVAEPAMVEPTVTTSLGWTQMQLGWCLMHNTGHLSRLHSLCIPKGGEQMIVGRVLKFFEEKRGDGKNFWRQEGGMPIYLDAIERLTIYNIVDKTPLVQWRMFLLSFTLCSNQFYLHYH